MAADRVMTASNKFFGKEDFMDLIYLQKRVANSSPKIQEECARIIKYKMIRRKAEIRRQIKNLNMEFDDMNEKFKGLFISKLPTFTPLKFYGRQKNQRPPLNANVVANRSVMKHIENRYVDFGTITESKILVNLVFAQNSKQGIFFVPRSMYYLLYAAFFELDKRLANNRLTMNLHIDIKIRNILLKQEKTASVTEAQVIPRLIHALRAYTIYDKTQQIWPDPEIQDSLKLIQQTVDWLKLLKEKNTKSEWTAMNIPLKRKSVHSYPRLALVSSHLLNTNDRVVTQLKPYFARKVCLKERPGFVCMHFDGIVNLSRVHKAIGIAERLEKPLRSFRGRRSQYNTKNTLRKQIKLDVDDGSRIHHSLISKLNGMDSAFAKMQKKKSIKNFVFWFATR